MTTGRLSFFRTARKAGWAAGIFSAHRD